jgi:hypothetical protein
MQPGFHECVKTLILYSEVPVRRTRRELLTQPFQILQSTLPTRRLQFANGSAKDQLAGRCVVLRPTVHADCGLLARLSRVRPGALSPRHVRLRVQISALPRMWPWLSLGCQYSR